jgi:hypothetical protein
MWPIFRVGLPGTFFVVSTAGNHGDQDVGMAFWAYRGFVVALLFEMSLHSLYGNTHEATV